MSVLVERVDVWSAGIQDKPGGLAQTLSGLSEAGADLDFILARRDPERDGAGVVFVTPLRADREVEAAAILGFHVTNRVHSVRVEGHNEPGAALGLSERLAAAGINMRGLSAAVVGARFIAYIGLDSAEDADKAVEVLQQIEALSW